MEPDNNLSTRDAQRAALENALKAIGTIQIQLNRLAEDLVEAFGKDLQLEKDMNCGAQSEWFACPEIPACEAK